MRRMFQKKEVVHNIIIIGDLIQEIKEILEEEVED
jgi:hypothetical protein